VSGSKSVGGVWWRNCHVINSFVVLEFVILGRNRGGSMRNGRWNIKSRYRIEGLIVNVPRLVSDAVGLRCSRPWGIIRKYRIWLFITRGTFQ
jgi:hypothetical protein